MAHDKRLPAPKHYPIKRKETKYISTIEGSRSRENAVPAVVVLREILGYAENETDAKKIVQDRELLRNGEPVTDIRQGIGILDTVELPKTEEAYRVLRSGQDLRFVPVTDEEKVVTKIVGKDSEGDGYVYRLHNGENYRTDDEYATGNTLIFNSSVTEVELEEGAQVVVIDGKHAGQIAELKEISEHRMNPDIGVIEADTEFETQLKNLVAVEKVQLGEEQ